MFSSDQLNSLMREITSSLGIGNGKGSKENNGNGSKENNGGNKIKLTPSAALVIVGLIGGALEVDSVLVDREREVQILLVGSLEQKTETELDKVLNQIGGMPFDEVLKAVVGRLK